MPIISIMDYPYGSDKVIMLINLIIKFYKTYFTGTILGVFHQHRVDSVNVFYYDFQFLIMVCE